MAQPAPQKSCSIVGEVLDSSTEGPVAQADVMAARADLADISRACRRARSAPERSPMSNARAELLLSVAEQPTSPQSTGDGPRKNGDGSSRKRCFREHRLRM